LSRTVLAGGQKGESFLFLTILREDALTVISVGYVEFKNEESVPLAIQLTGQKLLGIPIIAQLTEAEKNRQAKNPDAASGHHTSAPFHRLYVGNIHFSITENDLQNVFEPFGELEFVQLQKDENGRSRGYGFVQ
jgi:RNA-binding protein 39